MKTAGLTPVTKKAVYFFNVPNRIFKLIHKPTNSEAY